MCVCVCVCSRGGVCVWGEGVIGECLEMAVVRKSAGDLDVIRVNAKEQDLL